MVRLLSFYQPVSQAIRADRSCIGVLSIAIVTAHRSPLTAHRQRELA